MYRHFRMKRMEGSTAEEVLPPLKRRSSSPRKMKNETRHFELVEANPPSSPPVLSSQVNEASEREMAKALVSVHRSSAFLSC